MAPWRDPLDDLVEDLQRALPQVSSRQPPLPSFVHLQKAVQLVLHAKDGEAMRRLDLDLWLQRLQVQLAAAVGVASLGKREV